MSTGQDSTEGSPEEIAIRTATLLSTVLNMEALVHDEAMLQATDSGDLRETLLWIADEMGWLGVVVAGGSTAGISWPRDAHDRIERLRATAGAWDPVTSPPPDVLDAALACIKILQPSSAAPEPSHP